jgi:hypothetical protein
MLQPVGVDSAPMLSLADRAFISMRKGVPLQKVSPPAAKARATAAYAAGGRDGRGRGGRGLASLLQLGFVPAPGEAPEPSDGSPGLRVRGQLLSPPRGIRQGR